ncbi:MAG: nucleotide pyrophosphohydrolase [Planctomycetota bacterium]
MADAQDPPPTPPSTPPSKPPQSPGGGMTDTTATLAQCKALVDAFVAERDWHRFHQPKNLAMSIAIEAAELMEHFQWPEGESTEGIQADAERMQGVREELSDVLAYAFSLANALDIDIAAAFQSKMAHNARKYPPPP